MVSISACHAEDPGSIPGRGALFCEVSFFVFYSVAGSIPMEGNHKLFLFFQADCILLVGLAEKTLLESTESMRKVSFYS